MSGANVKAISALKSMRVALLTFRSNAQSSLEPVRNSAQRTLSWLQERLQYWQRECERRQKVLMHAQRTLDDCERARSQARSKEGGRSVDCSSQQNAMRKAKRDLEEAQHELHTVQHYLGAVEEAFARFQREAYHFNSMLNTELVQGTSLLQRASTILTNYARGDSGGSSDGISSVSPLPPGLSNVQIHEDSSFSILDWTGYPSSLPRPQGPFRILMKDEYANARDLGNKGARDYKLAHPLATQGKQVHHIQPIKFGGDPIDPANLFPLTREEHQLYTVWWSRFLAQMQP